MRIGGVRTSLRQCYKTFSFVSDADAEKARAFVTNKFFASKTRAYNIGGLYCALLVGRLLSLLTNVRPTQKDFSVTNALAFSCSSASDEGKKFCEIDTWT